MKKKFFLILENLKKIKKPQKNYCHFTMLKYNMDSFSAIHLISKCIHKPIKSFGIAGNKVNFSIFL